MSRTIVLGACVLLGAGVLAAGQSPRRCEGRACTSADLWAGVNDAHALKNQFVDALRAFAEAASGSYGDEGVRLQIQIDAIQQSLDAWDAAVAAYADQAASTQTAEAHAALGTMYLDRLRAHDAVREFTAAARLDPRRPDVIQMSATALEFAGDTRGAASALERARTLAPADVATLYDLSVRYLELNQPAMARALQTRLASLDEPSAQSADHMFARAGLLRQVADVAPIFLPEIYTPAARLLELGQLSEGITAMRTAVPRDPLSTVAADRPSASVGARLRQGQLQAALAAVRLLPVPLDAETNRVAGVAYWADEQYDGSIAALTRAIALNGRDERARIALADVQVAAGDRASAERTLRDTIAAMPASGLAHFRLGQVLQAESRIADAIEQYERAAECAPLVGLDRLFDVVGGLYATQADLDRAGRAYRRRVNVNPGHGDGHRKLGEIYALQGDHTAALAEFAVASWLTPGDASALGDAAQSDLRLERFADAARAARAALALDPSLQTARFALGTALTRLGDVDAGQRELDVFQRQVDDTATRRRRALEVAALVAESARLSAGGDVAASVDRLQRALDAAPGDVDVELLLAAALVRAGRSRESLPLLAHARLNRDDAEVHKLSAEAYAALGDRSGEREREELAYRVLLERRKEARLRERPLLR